MSTDLDAAIERMNAADSASRGVLRLALEAEAEVLRLTFLKFVDEHEGVTGFTFETEYEYDDEGGYYRSASVYASYGDEDSLEHIDEYEFMDAMYGFSPETICILCGVDEDATEGQVTVAEARGRSF